MSQFAGMVTPLSGLMRSSSLFGAVTLSLDVRNSLDL